MRAPFVTLPILVCAASTTKTTNANGHHRRQFYADHKLHVIIDTEVWSNTEALLAASREDLTDDHETTSRNVPCSSPSAKWLRQQVGTFTEEDMSKFFHWHVYALPFAYKLFVESEEERQDREEYCGLNGEYTQEIKSIHEQAQEFWSESDVDDDIRVLCAHGSDLADLHDKLIPTLNVMFSGSYDDYYTVFDHATEIQELITRLPGGYKFPLLTFNAFATDEADEHDFPSIIIGDGYFEFQQSVGLGYEGPEYALTHEHAHHLQFSLDAKDNNSTKDTTRQELMADAFSAYFLAHNSGGNMTAEELSNIHSVAYSVGDCEMGKEDKHHGTPQQRRCATRWGTSVAGSGDAANINLIELKHRFDVWYDESLDDPNGFCEYITSAASSGGYYTSRTTLQLLAFLYGSAHIMFGS